MRNGGGLWQVSVVLALAVQAVWAERPAFQNLRYEEDAAAYRDIAPETALDRLKFIALNDDGTIFASLGGQARLRWEYWENFAFAPANDDNFGLLRLRLHADTHMGSHFRVFVEGKSAEATRRDLPGGRRTLDVDTLDLQNAFADLRGAAGNWTITLRLGRQELSYGAQRLVSPLDWANTRRTFDGGRVIFADTSWRIDAFATRAVEIKKYAFNEPDSDTGFYGLYAVKNLPDWKTRAEFYALWSARDNLPGGDEDRYTTGARLAGTCPLTGLGYDLEGARQFGERGDQDIEAWFAAAKVSYTFDDIPMKPLIYIGYDHASGDGNPDDNKLKTFDQLYPLGHAYLGYIDLLGRRNLIGYSQGFSFWPIEKKLQASVDYHYFRRAERADAVYNVGGGIFREGDAGDSRDIGSELDLTLSWRLNRNTAASAGYSVFFAGDFIEQSGPSSDIHWGYLSVQYTF